MTISTTELLLGVYGAIVSLGVLSAMLVTLWFRVNIYPYEKESATYRLATSRQDFMSIVIRDDARRGIISNEEEAYRYEHEETLKSIRRVEIQIRRGKILAVGLSMLFLLLIAVAPVVISFTD